MIRLSKMLGSIFLGVVLATSSLAADQTVNGNLIVTGKIIAQDEVEIGGSLTMTTNGQSAIMFRDKDGANQTALFLDAWDAMVFGPFYSTRIKPIQYILNGTEARELLFHGWTGSPTPGLSITDIQSGAALTYPGTGGMVFTTPAEEGAGVRLDFANLFTRTDRRTTLQSMITAENKTYIDVQFGFQGKVAGTHGLPGIYLRYVTGSTAGNWIAVSDDGNGHVSTTILSNPACDQLNIRQQVQITWLNAYGAGIPANVKFEVANSNNEFVDECTAVHTAANGSLAATSVDLYAYEQYRTNGNLVRRIIHDYTGLRYER